MTAMEDRTALAALVAEVGESWLARAGFGAAAVLGGVAGVVCSRPARRDVGGE